MPLMPPIAVGDTLTGAVISTRRVELICLGVCSPFDTAGVTGDCSEYRRGSGAEGRSSNVSCVLAKRAGLVRGVTGASSCSVGSVDTESWSVEMRRFMLVINARERSIGECRTMVIA